MRRDGADDSILIKVEKHIAYMVLSAASLLSLGEVWLMGSAGRVFGAAG